MESEEALGALCVMISCGMMIVTGEYFIALCALGLLYVYLSIVGA